MSFKPGQIVKAVGLFREAEVISVANARGEFQVRVGAVTLWVAADKLKLFELSKKKAGKSRSTSVKSSEKYGGATSTSIKIDLHGKTVKEAEQILESTLDSALLSGAELIEVVHGRGSGKLKSLVHQFAKSSAQIAELREDMANPGRCLLYL